MAASSDYLPIATAVGNNADSQGDFAGSGYQLLGFTDGTADPAQVNKCLRQSSMFASALSWVIANTLNINVPDDGNLAALIGLLISTFTSIALSAQNALAIVAYSVTPAFHAAAARQFQITLTGNVTSSTLDGLVAGMTLIFYIKQDGAGARTFVPPANLPIPLNADGVTAAIDPTPNSTSGFMCGVRSDLTLQPLSGITVN